MEGNEGKRKKKLKNEKTQAGPAGTGGWTGPAKNLAPEKFKNFFTGNPRMFTEYSLLDSPT